MCRGSSISKIIGAKCACDDEFDSTVNMYVYEEIIGGEKLTEIINTKHENVKYLPGHKLPENVVCALLLSQILILNLKISCRNGVSRLLLT